MYGLLLLFPLLGFLSASLGGFYFGREGISLLVCLGQILGWFGALFAAYEVIYCQATTVVALWDWAYVDGYAITFGLLFDPLSCTMGVIIMTVSMGVHLYSLDYMADEPYLVRFLAYLSLFTFFMLLLVSADNFLQLFMGWEGVGLCSYLLINFWHKRVLANKAALKAMMLNRVGDVFLLLATAMVLVTFKTVDFLVVAALAPSLASEAVIFLGFWSSKGDVLCLFLLIAAVGKSAQLGLHLWLPDAMEGPTPVSALLHAATMVTAGIFLILRSAWLFQGSSCLLFAMACLGALSSWFFSLTGAYQYDIKKVIAYSTCSQLGYMVFCCGLGLFQLGLFHLFNHAFFKALLFLSAGSVIHALHGEQDLRRLGGLAAFLPFTYLAMALGSLAILGFPFLAGFFSKDLVLELAHGSFVVDGFFVHFLGTSGAFFTAFYSLRFISAAFWGAPRLFRPLAGALAEGGAWSTLVLAGLGLLSLFSGYCFSELFLGPGGALLAPGSQGLWELALVGEAVNPWVKNLPFLCGLVSLGLFFFLEVFFFEPWALRLYEALAPYAYCAQYYNVLFNGIFSGLLRGSYKGPSKVQDRGFLEFLGPYGLYRLFFFAGSRLKALEPWAVFHHISLLLLGSLAILLFFLLHLHLLLVLIGYLDFFAVVAAVLCLDALWAEEAWKA